ncbi:hypothetical protein [Streptomyces sp. RTd22]|uniref:hypothetical protein n=1 Tax=Streptomyces sp. RTd22 TaxID=1841249 RepID=UPI0007C4A22F|nr:hypothetical protein [Streptomyces sp. RTd22]
MGGFLPYLIFVGALAAVMGLFAWLAVVARRRGVAGSAIRAAVAAHDQAWQVSGYQSHLEVRAQAERKAPIESPDRPWHPASRDLGSPRPAARGSRRGRLRRGLRRRFRR